MAKQYGSIHGTAANNAMSTAHKRSPKLRYIDLVPVLQNKNQGNCLVPRSGSTMFHKQSLDIRNFEHTSEAGEGMFKPGSASRDLKTVAEFQKCGTEHKGALSFAQCSRGPWWRPKVGGTEHILCKGCPRGLPWKPQNPSNSPVRTVWPDTPQRLRNE